MKLSVFSLLLITNMSIVNFPILSYSSLRKSFRALCSYGLPIPLSKNYTTALELVKTTASHFFRSDTPALLVEHWSGVVAPCLLSLPLSLWNLCSMSKLWWGQWEPTILSLQNLEYNFYPLYSNSFNPFCLELFWSMVLGAFERCQ